MIGQEWFAKFAKENGISYETGLPQRLDKWGNEYTTLVSGANDFSVKLLRLLGGDKYVIIRMYPHYNDGGLHDLIRIRFSSYPVNPLL